MTELDLTSDFDLLSDHLESVTLRRRGSASETRIESAYRQRTTTQQAEPGDAVASQSDATWHLQAVTNEDAPQVGDIIIDQHRNHWTVLEIQHLHLLGRWRCETRELRLAYGCHQRVDVQRAVWGDIGSGPEITDWKDVYAAVPVSIRLVEMRLNSATSPPLKEMIYEIILSESLDLEPNDRLIDDRGNVYRLESHSQAEDIGSLPVARAVLEELD